MYGKGERNNRRYYLRLKEAGKPYGVILNNIKNKLIHLVFALVRNDTDFDMNYETIINETRTNMQKVAI